jgi:hypothetical protein
LDADIFLSPKYSQLPTYELFNKLKALREKYKKDPVNKQNIGVLEANERKRAIQNWEGKNYGEHGRAVESEWNKAIGHGLRKAIEKDVPRVGPLNRRIAQLLDLQGPHGAAVNRILNNNTFRTLPVVGAVAASAAGMPVGGLTAAGLGGFTGAAMWGLGHPATKAGSAFRLKEFSRLAPSG